MVLSSLSAVALSACTQLGIAVANLPAKLSDDLQIKKDIAYGDAAHQKLDIYIPKKAANKKLPVVIFFYGGRWTDGSKDMYAFIGKNFADRGYITVIPDYNKYPKVKFPTFVQDGAKAVAWTHQNITQYKGNPKNLYVIGHSSGAHIGALVVADSRYLKAENLTPNIISAFVGKSGPYDFIPQVEDLKDMFGPPSKYPVMQVPTHINGDEPPMLLLWGAEDETVIHRNMDRLEAKIKAQKGIVETKIYSDVAHVDMISSLTWFLPKKAPIMDDIDEFFKKYR